MDSYLVKHTTVKLSELKAKRKQMIDWYIDEKEAIKCKIIDKAVHNLYDLG
jgi:hypothetical protein